jgi:hypothetical protein
MSLLAFRVLRRRTWLDRDLAAGRTGSPALALRAEQLITPRSRRGLARGLSRLLADAEAARAPLTAVVAPCRGEVRAARPGLEALIARLRDGGAVGVQGVALVRLLLVDGASPAYVAGAPGALAGWARTALRALSAPSHDFQLPA